MDYHFSFLYKIMTQIYCGATSSFFTSRNMAQELIWEGALLCNINDMKSNHYVIFLFPPKLTIL